MPPRDDPCRHKIMPIPAFITIDHPSIDHEKVLVSRPTADSPTRPRLVDADSSISPSLAPRTERQKTFLRMSQDQRPFNKPASPCDFTQPLKRGACQKGFYDEGDWLYATDGSFSPMPSRSDTFEILDLSESDPDDERLSTLRSITTIQCKRIPNS